MTIEKYYDIGAVPYERKSKERVLTGFNDLDYNLKGLEIGVTLLVANTNSGKSTLCQNILAQAVSQGYKAWVFSGEHTAESFLQLLYHQNTDKKDYEPIVYQNWKGEETNIVDWYVNAEKEQALRDKFAGKLFIYSNKARRDIDSIIDSMTACHKEQGARFFLIDNISSNVFAEQTIITEKIRTFALNYKVFVLLVAHQRKIADKGFRIDIQDVAGSQNISNKAYNVLAQYRTDMLNKDSKEYKRFAKDLAGDGFDIDQCDGVLEGLKTKGTRNGLVGLAYDAEQKVYKQAPKITKTKADEIYKRMTKQESIDDLQPLSDEEAGEIPW